MKETVREKSDPWDTGCIDLQKLLMVYLRKAWLILLCLLLGAGAMLIYTKHFVVPLYRASVTVYVNNSSAGERIDSVSGGSLAASQQLVSTYVNIIKSDTVLTRVVEETGLDCTAAQIRSILSAEQVGETELFNIYVSHSDPGMATRIANSVALVAPGEIGKIVEGSSTKIIDYAKVPTEPYSPNVQKNVFMGAAVGGLLALACLALACLLDVRIKDEEELRALAALPILGQIPVQKEGSRILPVQSDFFVREAYKTLRTNVTFSLAGEDGCKVVAVTSSLQSEGKSITAVNLALSFAEMDKRVLLMDCDMRCPGLGRLLELSAPAGLSNLLLDPELLDQGALKGCRGIDVILAGSIPPNPSELLGSARMERLLRQMQQRYDYIILDTPAVNLVTDAVVLAPWSSGVLFAVRANQSERGAVVHAVEQLEYAQVKLLGFVLNGVDLEKSGCGYGRYRYKKYKRCGGCKCGYPGGYSYPPQPEERGGP